MGYGVAFARPRTDDADTSFLFDGQFAFHVRVIPVLQIGLALGGGFEVDKDHDGYAGLFVDTRYSFAAERPWHPVLAGGIGYSRGTFVRGGAGIERRFVSWAFSVEAHLTRTGGNNDELDEFPRFGAWGGGLDLVVHYHWGGGKKRRRFVP